MPLDYAGWDQHWSHAFNQYAANGLRPARVFTLNRDIYGVYTEFGEAEAEVAGALLYRSEHYELPAVGDWVAIRQYAPGDLAIIHEVLPRRTKFSRKSAGARMGEQVIAANIDLLCVICGLDQDFNLRRIERYLVAAGESGAELLIVLNKLDLCPDAFAREQETRDLAPGCPVLALRDGTQPHIANCSCCRMAVSFSTIPACASCNCGRNTPPSVLSLATSS